MAYRVDNPLWGGGVGLASSTPVVLLPKGLLGQLPAGWQSAAQSGGAFTFYAAQTHQAIVTITTAGALGTAVLSYAIDGFPAVTGVPMTPQTGQTNFTIGLIGLLVTFAPGTYVLSSTYTINLVDLSVSLVLGGGAINTVTVPPTVTSSGAYHSVLVSPGPPPVWTTTTALNQVALTVETLAGALVGDQVLIQMAAGAGWILGTVVSDATTQLVTGLKTALAVGAKAYAPGVIFGYQAPVILPDSAVYTIRGTSADGHVWFTVDGVTDAFEVNGSLTTLGALSRGQLALIDITPGGGGGAGDQFRMLTV